MQPPNTRRGTSPQVRIRLAIAITAAAGLIGASSAFAAPSAATTPTPRASDTTTAAAASKPTTRSYDLDFTLPTAGKSGCLVCHGDESLARISLETTTSIYVDLAVLSVSAHEKDTPCTGCHLDFAYTSPHNQVEAGGDWQTASKVACKNCHQEAFSEYANGMHSPAGQPGTTATETAAARVAKGKPERVPFCGDCHGGHAIPSMNDTESMKAVHRSGNEMCGQCHTAEADSYEDYYHGAAYRRGSLDAPSCWDCHGYHEIIPIKERTSPVHPSRLTETCGQQGCHADVDEQFMQYAELIHGQRKIRNANPVVSVVGRIKHSIGSAFDTVRSWF